MLVETDLEIDSLPYVDELDWDKPLYDQIDEILSSNEISKEDFMGSVKKADEYADNFGWLESLDKIIEDHKNGWDFDYKDVFGSL